MNTTYCKQGSQDGYPGRNHFLTALLIAVVMMISTVPAFAAEATVSATAPDIEGSISTSDLGGKFVGEDGMFTDDESSTSESAPPPTSGPVSTIEELLEAIANANENDVIEINGTIRTGYELTLGRADCPVTIRRATPESYIMLGLPGMGNTKVQNITFDGEGIHATYPFVDAISPTSIFENCNFVNCYSEQSSALEITSDDSFISDCHFSNNTGLMGAHLRVGARKASIENCTFTGGYASITGSVYIGITEKTFLTGCTISGNTAGERGGGICIEDGELIVARCKIFGNTSNGVADDITKGYRSHLSLSDNHAALIGLYESDGVIPNMWAVDSRYDLMHGTDPECADMIFSMTFADNEPVPTPKPEPETFIVTFNANGGTVFPAAATTNESGTIVLPTPEREGYIFGGWFMEDGTPVTTDTVFTKDMEIYAQWTDSASDPDPEPSPTSITLDKLELTLDIGDTDSLTATLQPEGANGNIQWTSSDPDVASVTESGFVTAYSAGTALITATETVSGTSASCRVNVHDVSNTPDIPNTSTATYSIDISTSPIGGGTVSGSGQYEEGAIAIVTAAPNEGFRFLAWTEADTQISTESSLTFTVSSDRNLTAVFEPIPKPSYTINAAATVGGTANGSGEYKQGASVTLTATPESEYLFTGWTENDEQVSTKESFTFTADRDRTLVANFELFPKPTYTIQANSTQGGIVYGGNSYKEGELVTVNAVPDNGYRFLYWKENGVQISTEARYSFTAEENRTLVAVFELIPQSTPNLPLDPPHNLGTTTTSYGPGGGKSKPDTTFISLREEIQIPRLIYGNAVLIAPDDLFWGGYKTGRNNGTANVTRADLAQLIYSMMDNESGKSYGATQSFFTDVRPGAWYEAAVRTMLDTGIMVGCGNDLFCPERTLTWGELLTVFARFSDDVPPTEYYTGKHWAKNAINKAFTHGWLEYTESFDPGSIVTTSEMVDLIQAVFRWNSK